MRKRVADSLRKFVALESSGGIALVLASVAALVIANTPANLQFHQAIDPYHSLISQWLMAIFFFLVGLEIRNELRFGELRNPKNAAFPVIAALGGMAAPALIYLFINHATPAADAWAVPMPTDIALALGALALLGARIDTSLKIFLLTLAIADDLFSILVIGIFYSNSLDFGKIFATIGVVLIAIAMPELKRFSTSTLIRMIHPWSALFIIPLFALANIGVELDLGNIWESISSPVSSGIILGRVLGKIIGITFFAWLAVQLGVARKPSSLSFLEISGAAALAGMGLTVSLFIAELAITDEIIIQQIKLGLVIAALISAIIGILILRKFSKAED